MKSHYLLCVFVAVLVLSSGAQETNALAGAGVMRTNSFEGIVVTNALVTTNAPRFHDRLRSAVRRVDLSGTNGISGGATNTVRMDTNSPQFQQLLQPAKVRSTNQPVAKPASNL